jgi:hypothetical protein
MTGARPLAAAACAALALSACESTQDRSARLQKEGKAALNEKGLKITKRSTAVDLGDTTLLQDQNGAAVVVEVRNETDRALTNVPIAVDVADRSGRSIYRNDVPGLEPSLTSIPVLGPKEEFAWVNDQLTALGSAGTVRRAKAEIGVQKAAAPPKEIPELRVGRARLRIDPVSGIEATGYVFNESRTVEQRNVFVHCVARRNGRIVAAGRSRIERIKPGRRGRYHIFFIGNPRGAKLELKAPPVVLEPRT